MSLDKAIEYGKEHRKQYRKYCEAIDKQCRPHRGCEWCKSNRFHKIKKQLLKLEELENDIDE
jgi:hypothetical protein